jgi:hypothetical protein
MTRIPAPTRTAIALTAAGAAAVVAVPMVARASTETTSTSMETSTVAAAADTTTGLSNAQLTEMREEERVARDLYEQLAETSGSSIFTRIAASEQHHLDAVENLMEMQGMDPETAGTTVGEYAVPSLQTAYDTWLDEGSGSAEEAFAVGVDLETQDIAELKSLDPASGTPAERVVAALLQGSQHHLAAFTAAVNEDLPEMGTGAGAGYGPGAGMGLGAGMRPGTGMGWSTSERRGMGPGDGTCLTDGDDETQPGSGYGMRGSRGWAQTD